MDRQQEKTSRASLFVERFDDFFKQGLYPAIATGFMLAYAWMGLAEGYPIFMDGGVDLPSVIVLLASFCVSMVALGFAKPVSCLMAKPAAWLGFAIGSSAVCLCLLALFLSGNQMSATARLLVRCSMAVIGSSTSVLLMCCVTGFSCLKPASAGVAFSFSIAVLFTLFFCLHACNEYIEGVLFCLVPTLASLALCKEKDAIAIRLSLPPEEKLPFAKGFVSMCVSFGVFFFAIGAKCAFEPISEFAMGSDTSIIGILLVSLVFLYLVGLRRKTIGIFVVLKRFYSLSVLILTVCIAMAPLSIEPYVGIVYNADVLVIILVLWLLTAFVAHSNETDLAKVVAVAFSASALGMMGGWTAGTLIYSLLGHARSYPTIAIACAVAVFSTVGFSSKDFPRLTQKGEGAQKMTKQVSPYEPEEFCAEASEQYRLSEREREVLSLLLMRYGAEAISSTLVISYHTVRTHIRNIYKKMDVHSQQEVISLYDEAKASHDERASQAG